MIKQMKELFTEAHGKINEKEREKEAAKLGTLRAGSSGALVDDKAYYAQCGRLAQARMLGYQSEPTEEMRVMFTQGLALEDYIEERFKALGLEYGKEEPVETFFDDIGFISGRPDYEVFIRNENGGLKLVGIEVKSLASPFSVIKQKKNDFPLMKHLIQSVTYMLITNRDEWMICIGHAFFVNQNGKKHNPELRWYHVKKSADGIRVFNESGKAFKLPFDFSHILAYYKEVRSKTENKQLMARPTELELQVDTYNRCNYCPMKSACNEYEANQITFDQWLERVKVTKENE